MHLSPLENAEYALKRGIYWEIRGPISLSPLENHRYAMRCRSIQLSPLEGYGYASMRVVAKGAHGEIRGEIRLSPLENADYADTQNPHVNPVSTPCQPRVIPASTLVNPAFNPAFAIQKPARQTAESHAVGRPNSHVSWAAWMTGSAPARTRHARTLLNDWFNQDRDGSPVFS
jgi:hypothetical protein